MKIEKDKCRVNIVCMDGSCLKGTIHVSPGLRTNDLLNDIKESFIAVTEVEFSKSNKLSIGCKRKEDMIMLNKLVIKWVEEL